MRMMLYEAAQSMLVRSTKWSWLKAWAMKIARHRGMKKAIVALARRLTVIMHRIWVDGTELAGPRCNGRITDQRHARRLRRNLFEQLQPFRAHAEFKRQEPGDVAAGPSQALDEAGADGIGEAYEYDRHRPPTR